MKDKSMIWQRHIERQQNSSFTIQAYCNRHDLSPGMFYYWKRKIAGTADSLPASFQELEILTSDRANSVIEVHLVDGKRIRIEGYVTPAFLRELLQC